MSLPAAGSEAPNTPDALVARLRAAGCVFAEDEARLLVSSGQDPATLDDMVDRRVAGVPLEYVLGWAEFCGLRIAVDEGVFVPRQRTEFLVRQAAELLRATPGPPDGDRRAGRLPVVLDMCCGSGAIGAALAAAVGEMELYATDIDPAAVRCASRNVASARGRVFQGDLYEPLPGTLRGRVDILAANAPYVPTEAIGMMPPEARLHERLVALDGGSDGLDVVRRVAAQATEWLAPGGHLLIEANERQLPSAAESFARNGLAPRIASSEEFGSTLVIGMMIGMGSEWGIAR